MVEGEYSIEDLGLPMTAVTVVNIRCSGNEWLFGSKGLKPSKTGLCEIEF
jgi:hypothetical protein